MLLTCAECRPSAAWHGSSRTKDVEQHMSVKEADTAHGAGVSPPTELNVGSADLEEDSAREERGRGRWCPAARDAGSQSAA
mmetsp:Transcript_16526/g.45147  ORF Transcript_16526/g.45147 Transcript_16526/m.45147 type:complete len:81 (-) Transcript_16526:23-265(-)